MNEKDPVLLYVKNLGKGLKIGLKSSSIIIVMDTDIGLRMLCTQESSNAIQCT